MTTKLETLWQDLFCMVWRSENLVLFKSKLTKEVLFYHSPYGGFILNTIVWANFGCDYIKAIIEFVKSYGERMRLFSLKSRDNNDLCALETAIKNRSIRITNILLEYGARPYIRNFDALNYTIYNNDYKMMMLLLRHGARLHLKTYSKCRINVHEVFRQVNLIKIIETLASPLIVTRLRKRGSVYINKDIVRELLYFLI